MLFTKPHLYLISYIITALISSESVVTSDIARELKDDFSLVFHESVQRRIRRFFASFSSLAYSAFEAFISFVVSKFLPKHPNDTFHISLDHMFCKDKFTILLFSLRIGKQGIPIWFRCFKGKHNSEAYSLDLIKDGISFCSKLFEGNSLHLLFLADRWFGNLFPLMKYINFPPELNKESDYYYLSTLLYPNVIKIDIKQLVLRTYKDVLSGRLCKFPKEYLSGTEGMMRAGICLQYMLNQHYTFPTIKDMYKFFSEPAGSRALKEYRLNNICNEIYECPIDYLHEALPNVQKNEYWYHYYRFRVFNSQQIKKLKKKEKTG